MPSENERLKALLAEAQCFRDVAEKLKAQANIYLQQAEKHVQAAEAFRWAALQFLSEVRGHYEQACGIYEMPQYFN